MGILGATFGATFGGLRILKIYIFALNLISLFCKTEGGSDAFFPLILTVISGFNGVDL